MGTAIVKSDSSVSAIMAKFGTEDERRYMLGVMAEELGIPADEVDRPDVQGVLAQAAKWSMEYGCLPGIHMNVMPFKKNSKTGRMISDGRGGQKEEWITVQTYQLNDARRWYLDTFDQYRREHKTSMAIVEREATQEEMLKEYAAAGWEYDEKDAGAYAALVRSDEIQLYKEMGMEYRPQWQFGCFRHRIRQYTDKGQKKWQGDTLPATETPQQVAAARAQKKAIKSKVAPRPVFGRTQEERMQHVVNHLEEVASERKRITLAGDSSPVVGSGLHPDDNMLFAGTHRGASDDHEYAEFSPVDEAPANEPADDAPSLAAPGQVKAIVSLCKSKHGNEADEFMGAICNDHGVNTIDQLTSDQAAVIIATLNRLPDVTKKAKQPA